MIQFNGTRSSAMSVFVEKYPPRPIPQRKCERFSVPGRSGDVIAWEDAWENVTQKYSIYLSAEGPGLPIVAAKVTRWLFAEGYLPLEDEYDRDTFRLACFTGPVDLENTLNVFGRAEISFDCQPQRFLKSGWEFRSVAQGAALVNPTGFPARPIIRLHGSGAAMLTIGGQTLTLVAHEGMILDCAEEEAYLPGPPVSNLNTAVSGQYPKLGAGSSTVSWTGGISGVDISPRWYEL